ncbi:ABC transporter substrate-binding protein [Numidum massiliense]|uniref:ABC transporter substrate-binding protein n=1 Tax=Numidum massiliense TaxID=1522315 RepID=UPI0006D5514F|nr:ABC transporter substrate-binding protein [Numidum massiliense]
MSEKQWKEPVIHRGKLFGDDRVTRRRKQSGGDRVIHCEKYWMNRRCLTVVLLLLCTILVVACGTSDTYEQQEKGETVATVNKKKGEEPFLTFTDDAKKTVTLVRQPKRIVVITPEFLKMLYALGGEAVGRMTTSSIQVPPEAEHVQQLGTINQINVEQLTALKPDLVIGAPSFHTKLSDVMASNDIPFALLQMRAFDDVKEKAELLGKIVGNEAKAVEEVARTEKGMQELAGKLTKGERPSFVVLNVSPKNVSIQRANTTALEIGDLLQMDNVAKQMDPSPDSQTSAPYSMEKLVEAQPDFIFITVHGAAEVGMKKVKEELEGNPAWASLKAVQNKRAVVIPSDKFLTNPGFAYDESMAYMARIVYPHIFRKEKR